ncbi:hypothetical protein OAM67_00680 [bacterium]|nr:hypothetical protein [bacterium]
MVRYATGRKRMLGARRKRARRNVRSLQHELNKLKNKKVKKALTFNNQNKLIMGIVNTRSTVAEPQPKTNPVQVGHQPIKVRTHSKPASSAPFVPQASSVPLDMKVAGTDCSKNTLLKPAKVWNVPFAQKYDFDQRRAESRRLMTVYEDRFPVVLTVDGNVANQIGSEKYFQKRFMAQSNTTVAELMMMLRQRLDMGAIPMQLQFGTSLCQTLRDDMYSLFMKNHAPDGFLYVKCM